MGMYADVPGGSCLNNLPYVKTRSHKVVELIISMQADPVSAFSLAAGTIQVVDVSFRAVSACREIYKNGSLAQYRDSQEVTQQLLETTRNLEKSYTNVSTSAAKHSNDVVDLSKKCSETATEVRASIMERPLQHCPRPRNVETTILISKW